MTTKAEVISEGPSMLQNLENAIPKGRIFTTASAEFGDLCSTYIKDDSAPPLAIVRPQSESEVASTVAYTNEHSIPLAVRSGGHDNRGRSRPSDVLVLDMRELRSVEIVDEGKAAVIGGGINAQDLADSLGKTGHTAAYGASGTVGYVGWATHGGYGPFSGVFGMGVDQILGARVVDFQGNIQDASEELLYGIRGAGSAFGVIVSLKIKIYKLDKILAGGLIFSLGPVENVLSDFIPRYQSFIDQGLPKELGLELGVTNVPNVGKALFSAFVWASPDMEAGKAVISRMKEQLGHIEINAVFETSPAEWLRSQLKNQPQYGAIYTTHCPRSMLVPELDGVCDALVEYTKQLPSNPATLWLEHHMHGAALESSLPSCFPYREPHFVIEAICTSTDPESAIASGEWAVAFEKGIREISTTFNGGYVPLSTPKVPPASCYPGHWERLRELKGAFDPANRFSFSITGL